MTTAKKRTDKGTLQIEIRLKDEHIYWKKYVWDAKRPMAMIIGNYPGQEELYQDNLTSMLVKNAVIEMSKYGGVIIANLFTKPLQTVNERTLAEAFLDDGMEELIKACNESEIVILAIGSLANRFQVATDRLKILLKQAKNVGLLDKLYELTNGQHKRVHPLAIRNEKWSLLEINEERLAELMQL
ncbi:MAG: DUF1643 domain-containing protein [Liquorilactobacillus ghanensis]|uniref:DUF1643 domain-containing protein n=1 Tax=Liquorilactobacillus ghanensis TaxID=399370 RepID=UPI0039E7A4BE